MAPLASRSTNHDRDLRDLHIQVHGCTVSRVNMDAMVDCLLLAVLLVVLCSDADEEPSSLLRWANRCGIDID